jgi:NAD dependent epimerase/dehydratase family enzyme
LEIGAKLIGTETELVLKSRNVIPKRLLDAGFRFLYTMPETAIAELVAP